MALIEEYHVVADMYPVDPDTNPQIIEGMHVMLTDDGFVVPANGASGTWCLGVSGDSTTEETTAGQNNTPYQSDLVINAAGATRSTENRVSDMFNESLASSKLTVYQGGGKFHTDQYTTTDGFIPGDPCWVAAGLLTTIASANNQVIGISTVAPRQYPSGVPGTDTSDGSLSLGFYVTFMQINTINVL